MRSADRQYSEIELKVGETITIGNQTITLLEIDGEELFFQIEPDDNEIFSRSSTPPQQPPLK